MRLHSWLRGLRLRPEHQRRRVARGLSARFTLDVADRRPTQRAERLEDRTLLTSLFPGETTAVEQNPMSAATGDFNGDGTSDLVVANLNSNTVSVLLRNANGSFQTQVAYATGNRPISVTVGDFNGDGNSDLAVANLNSSNVSVLLGNGNGSFQTQVTYTTGSGPYSVTVGDFNEDGNSDLAVANNSSNTVGVLLGNGNGSFQTQVTYATGNSPSSVTVGDFNDDGNSDLAVANQFSNTVSVLLGNGNGSFQSQVTYAMGSNPISVTAGDFNSDGSYDIAVANFGGDTVSVLLGNGDGSFQTQVTYMTGNGPSSVAVGDFNGDGTSDLAVANSSNTVSVLMGTTNGSLQTPVTYAAESSPRSVAIGDFNGDGNSDLAVVNSGTNTVGMLLGYGNGVFQAQVTYATGNGPSSVAVGDFNGDGNRDLAVTNGSSNTVSVLLRNSNGSLQTQVTYATGSSPGSVTVGDFNRDGNSDLVIANRVGGTISVLLGNGNGGFQTPLAYVTGDNPFSVTIEDFNGDGQSDVAAVNFAHNTVSVLVGNGNGSFQTRVTYATGSAPSSVTTGDFNHDGNRDLAVAALGSNTVSVLLGNGNGSFQAQVNYAAGNRPGSVTVGDFNGDGTSDLAVTNDRSNTASVLLGNGNGSFQPPVAYATGISPVSLTVGDFNRDGNSDLAVTNFSSNTVSLLLGDGSGSFQSQIAYVTERGPVFVTVGDFNRDGNSDLAVANSDSNTVSELLNQLPPPGVLSVSVVNASLLEGQSGNTVFTFTVTRTGDASGTTSVDYTVAGSGAHPVDANDFGGTLPSGTVNFAPGETSKTITINLRGDTTIENDEGFTVTLLNPSTGATIVGGSSSGVISWFRAEGDAADTTGTNAATLRNGVSFAPSENGQAFQLDGVDDFVQVASPSELPVGNAARTMALRFKTPQNLLTSTESALVQYGTAANNQMFGLITTLNAPGKLYFFGYNNDLAGTTNLQPDTWYDAAVSYDGETLSLYLNGHLEASKQTTTLNTVLDTTGLTIGYRPDSNTHFTGLIDDVQIYDRALSEYELSLIRQETSIAGGVIVNDDASLAIAALSASKSEGQGGNTSFTFTVTRTGGTSGSASVDYSVNGSGTHPAEASDFGGTLPAGTVTFAAGETLKTISIDVSGDATTEDEEGFTVTLSNPSSGATIEAAVATGTILNDDFSIPAPSGLVGWWPGNGDALDVQGNNSGVLENGTAFVAGKVGQAFGFDGSDDKVRVNALFPFHQPGDASLEFFVNSSMPSHSSVFWTRPDDDDTNRFNFYVNSDATFGVDYRSPNGQVHSIFSNVPIPRDEWAHVAITRAGNEYRIYIDGVLNDTASDANPDLPTAMGWQMSGRGGLAFAGALDEVSVYDRALSPAEVQAIVNAGSAGKTEPPPTVSVHAADASRPEGNSGATQFTFTVTRTGDSSGTPSVMYTVTGGGTNPANANDFGGLLPSGIVTFAAGEISQTITILVTGDTASEGTEGFVVTLSDPSSDYALGTSSATGAILDDDTVLAPPSGLVSWFPGDGDALDVKRGVAGELVGSTMFVPGQVGQAFQFDGIDHEVRVNSSLPFQQPGDATLEFFLKSAFTDEHTAIIWGRADDSNNNRFNFYLNGDRTFGFDYLSPSGAAHHLLKDIPIPADQWAHLAITRTGNVYRVYVNGTLQGAVTDIAPDLPTASGWQMAGRTGFEFHGSLDELTFYNRALSANEVLAIANVGALGKTKPVRNADGGITLGAGALDPRFGGGGLTRVDFGRMDGAFSTALQPDGKIIVGGQSGDSSNVDFALARLNADGSLDTTYGTNGRTVQGLGTAHGRPTTDIIQSLAVQADGKTVVAGMTLGRRLLIDSYSPEGRFVADFVVARFNTDGSLDTSFRQVGFSVLNFTDVGAGSAEAVVIQPDQKILVAGIWSDSAVHLSGTPYHTELLRYNPDGSFDTSFGDNGRLTLNGSNFIYAGMQVQADGKILVVGQQNGSFGFARFNSDGSSDASFGINGIATTNVSVLNLSANVGVNSVAFQNDGKVVVAGYSDGGSGFSAYEFLIARFNADGSLDTTFDSDGRSVLDFGSNDDRANGLALQGNGKIIVTGFYAFNTDGGSPTLATSNYLAITRLNLDGSLDSTFASDGQSVISSLVPARGDHNVLVQNDGRIVVVGGAQGDFAVAQLLGEETSVGGAPEILTLAATEANNLEGDTGNSVFTFTITRTGSAGSAASVGYTVSGSSSNAADPSDFGGTFPSGTVLFMAGETSKTITIHARGDTVVEHDEGFTVTLSNPSAGLTIATATASGTILNDDTRPFPPAGLVSWWTGDGNAADTQSDNDGSLQNGVAFGAGKVGQTFQFDGVDDFIEVPDSSDLRLPDQVTINFWAQRTALDAIDIILEKGGDWTSGQTNYGVALHSDYNHMFYFFFAGGVRGTSGVADNLWHHYSVVATNGQANPTLYIDGVARPIEYSFGVGSLSLSPSTLPLHIGAQTNEPRGFNYYGSANIDELMIFNRALSQSEVQTIFDADSFGLIRPQHFSVQATSAQQTEGDSGNSLFTFTVTRTGDAGGPASVDFVVSGSGAEAADAADFGGIFPGGTLSFAAGEMSKAITFNVRGDAVVESSETFVVTLSNPSIGAVLETGTATGTILNDDTAGFIVTQSGGSTSVTEAGTTDTFTVVLTAQPSSNVVFSVVSSDPGEVAVSTSTLTFTPANWNVAQTITVTGINDNLIDGTQNSVIAISVVDSSSENNFDPLADQTVGVTTVDNDTAGFTVTQSGGSTGVSETGTTDTFTVVLTAQPNSNVVLSVSSNDVGEATVSAATLTFTPANWNVGQTVTVTGINDNLIDGTQNSVVTISVVDASSDNNFDPLADQKVAVSTSDNDTAGFTVTQSGGSTSVTEAGTTDIFTVGLTAQPIANVVLSVASSDPGEATVSNSTLTFTPANWNVAQTITVTGVNDNIIDGAQSSVVTISVIDASSDNSFDPLADQTVAVTTTDDDAAGFAVTASGGSTTVSESGTTDTVSVVLTAQPNSNVVLSVTSSDTGEVIVSPATLTFTPANWNVPQTVTVTGVNDNLADGAQNSLIAVGVVDASSDNNFDPLADKSLTVSTTDVGVTKPDLTITLTTNQSVVVQTSGGNVQVLINNVVNPAFSNISAASVRSITIDGGTGDNLIDLRSVTSASFSRVSGVTVVVQGAAGKDTILGSGFADHMMGGDGDDSLDGGAGNDSLEGGLGNDTLTGGIGQDALAGGDGTADVLSEFTVLNFILTPLELTVSGGLADEVDQLSGFEKAMLFGGGSANSINASEAIIPTSLFGGGGNDILIGGSQADSIDGQAGDDTVTGGKGNDTLMGGVGTDAFREIAYTDTVTGQVRTITLTTTLLSVKQGTTTLSTDSLSGFEAADLSAGGMRDVINAADFASSGVTTINGNGGNDVITGTAGADLIFTLSGADSINGGGGGDSIFAGGGNDTIIGGDGADNLNGQNGNDVVNGDGDNDVLIGGAGIDTMSGGSGNDFLSGQTEAGLLSGGDGNDTVQGNTANDTLNGDAGDDRLFGLQGDDVLNGGDGLDSLVGAIGNDSLSGGAGTDTLQGDLGNDTLDGGADFDRINEVFDTNVTIVGIAVSTTALGSDLVVAIERIQISGGAGNNLLDARLATIPVFLSGGLGNDTLLGGSKADGIDGGDGDDVVSGGAGADLILGGSGFDYWLEKSDSNFTVVGQTISSAATGSETVADIERIVLIGGNSANILNASGAGVPVILVGGKGNDSLVGGSLSDTMTGGNRNDTTAVGGDGTDSLDGGAGSDVLEDDPVDTKVTGPGDATVANVFALLPSWIDSL